MPCRRRLILHAPSWDAEALGGFVKACLWGEVVLVCVVGQDCGHVQDVTDALVVGDGSDESRFVNTTAHPRKTLDEVRAFAVAWMLDDGDAEPLQEVWLSPTDDVAARHAD